MENKQKILQKLKSNESEQIQEAIGEIKQQGDLSIIPELLDILLSSRDFQLISPLTTLLSDIRDTSFRETLMEKLIYADPSEARENLLRICWESSLDFSEYLEAFTGLLLDGDFITSLEASTVIENLEGKISEERIQSSILRLKTLLADHEKTFLAEDAMMHLDKMLYMQEEQEEEPTE